MNLGLTLALTSLFLVAGAAIWTDISGRPLAPGMERGVAFAGTLLAGTALASHPGAIGYGIAGIAFVLGGFFSFLTFMSRLPEQQAAVAVGYPAPDFRSLDSDGREFRLSELSGSRMLLKFFRGTWCPYCVADLRLWNEQREELRALGLRLVAVSHDSVEDLQRFKRGRDWDVTLVADPDLEIIRRYNLQNHNFTPKGGPFRDMAIPATILIDADGKVLWMSQASDFRVRSHPAKVLSDIRAVLGPGKSSQARIRPAYFQRRLGGNMTLFWRAAPWLPRLLLLLATVLFFLIGFRYLGDPVNKAAADSIVLGSVMAISRVRVGFGGFPLALSLILLGCLLSPKRLLTGLTVLATTVGVVTAARLVGIAIDGPAEEAVRLLRVEIILLGLSVAAIFLERARLRRVERL